MNRKPLAGEHRLEPEIRVTWNHSLDRERSLLLQALYQRLLSNSEEENPKRASNSEASNET